jgi:hypothetical protein
MFERYTESARHAVFFARYTASLAGSDQIEAEHVLIGALSRDKRLAKRVLGSPWAAETVWRKIEEKSPSRENDFRERDIQLSESSKQSLRLAMQEADRCQSQRIGTEHLILAILANHETLASGILRGLGLDVKTLREDLTHSPHDDSIKEEFVRQRVPVPPDVAELEEQLNAILRKEQQALADRDYEKAGSYLPEEVEMHQRLFVLYRQHGLCEWVHGLRERRPIVP